MSRMAQVFFVGCVSAAVGSVYYVHYTQNRDRKVRISRRDVVFCRFFLIMRRFLFTCITENASCGTSRY